MKIKNGMEYTYKNKYSAYDGFSGIVYDYDYDTKTFSIFNGGAWLILVKHRTFKDKLIDFLIRL